MVQLQSVYYLRHHIGTVLFFPCPLLNYRLTISETKLVVYRDTLLYLVPAFIVIRLYFCALMAMYVFFTCHFFAIFLILGMLSQPELTR